MAGTYGTFQHAEWTCTPLRLSGTERRPNAGIVDAGNVWGKFHLWRRLGLTVGTGVQVAATHFHTYNHAWILSTRLPFWRSRR